MVAMAVSRASNIKLMRAITVWTLLACAVVATWVDAAGIAPKTQAADKVIHLKHGKLHLMEEDDDSEFNQAGHLRYKWLEDDILKSREDDDYEIVGEMSEEGDVNMVQMPGGCQLTEDQFEELESFKKETHYVKKCYCEQGGVYCQLSNNFLRDGAT